MQAVQQETITDRLVIPESIDIVAVLGERDSNLRLLQERLNAEIIVRGNEVKIIGNQHDVKIAGSIILELAELVGKGERVDESLVEQSIEAFIHGDYKPSELGRTSILTNRGRTIKPKTSGQKRYVDAIRKNTITFGVGPAGTGKTYLAMACAVAALKRKEIQRIILTRPAVEAGESLGFLPGTLTEKVDPYLRPLYDALLDMMDVEKSALLIEKGVIEIAPLAFMRGRTLNDSFVILDEAQNTTSPQMKMFLTRLGFNSKMVITGDSSQVDLPRGVSGLREISRILKGLEDISFVELSGKDVVRHKLVQRIVAAYEEHESGIVQPKLIED